MTRQTGRGMVPRLDVAAARCADRVGERRLFCGRRATAISVGACGAPDWPAATTKLRVRLAGHAHRHGVSLGDPPDHSSGCLPSVPGLALGMTFSPAGYDAEPARIEVFLMTNSAARDGMR